MNDQSKTKAQLLIEINELRQQIRNLEALYPERKQADKDRMQSEQHYRLLLENIPSVVWVTTREGQTVFISDNIEKVYGFTSEEILSAGKGLWFDRIHPEDRHQVQEAFEALFSEQTDFKIEYRIQRKDGEWIWILDSANIVADLNGQPLAYGVFSDITDRKQAEDELRRISQYENKRREELEKLRDISTIMRQVEGSNNLMQVFTQEVQRLCQADITSSLLFKDSQASLVFIKPESNIKLTREQSNLITNALWNVKKGTQVASIPNFESVLIVQIQSSNTLHGAIMVASQAPGAFSVDEQNMLNAITDMAGTALHRIDILETLEERVQQRTHDLIVLYNLITIISENWRLQDILELSLVLTLETVKADRGIIYLADGKVPSDLKPVIQRGFAEGFQIETANLPDDKLARQVFIQHKALVLENTADITDGKFDEIHSYAGIPIFVRGEVRGIFSLFAKEEGVFGSDEMDLLASIADHLGIGIDNSILWEQSRENAALEERHRLARNLHDSVSQLLYSLTLMAGSTMKMIERGYDLVTIKNSVARLGETAHQALKEMRLLLYELRPAVIDSEGLVSALQHRIDTVEERLGVKVNLQAVRLLDVPSDIEEALYHIALEALNNIVKHSESTTASIRLYGEDENIVMEISDDGKGFDPNQPHKGLGLSNMRERVLMLNGELVIDSSPGNGTRIILRVKSPFVSLFEL